HIPTALDRPAVLPYGEADEFHELSLNAHASTRASEKSSRLPPCSLYSLIASATAFNASLHPCGVHVLPGKSLKAGLSALFFLHCSNAQSSASVQSSPFEKPQSPNCFRRLSFILRTASRT